MKRKILCRLPFLLAVALASSDMICAMAQDTNVVPDTNALTLDAAIHLALENNPELRSLAAGVAVARGEVITAKTWDNPELSVTPGAFHDSGGTWGHAGFELTQTILFPGKRALLRAVAEKNVEARQLALAGFRTQLTVQVRRAFNELLAAGQVVTLKERQLELAESFVEAARKKVEGGFAPEFEQIKAEVEVTTARKALREAQAREAVARTMLNSLAGRPPEAPLGVSGALDVNVLVPDEDTVLEQALLRNPSLKIQSAEVERTGLNLAFTRKSRLPDVTVGPSIEYQKPEQAYSFGISLPLPLWDKKKGAIATATAEQQRAMADLETTRRDIIRDASSGWRLLVAARESLAIYTPEFRAKLKSALDAAAQSYGEGRTSLLIFLETQRTYYDTEAEYFDTLRQLYDARAALEAAVGVPLNDLNRTELQEKK